jgi:CubicO group peptidase (beta-lactamase class C family)
VDEAALSALLREHMSRHSVPGAAIGILRDGSVTTAAYGTANVATAEPVTPATRFSVGSLTKSMVATAVAQLAVSGRLTLDEPVVEHVPELRGSVWAAGVTLRDLLANRAGLPLGADLEFGFDLRPEPDDGALQRLVADIPQDAVRSPVWSYSNVGWCVLGRAIEGVTGAVWEEAIRDHVLDAAGMGETTFVAGSAHASRAAGHRISATGPVPVEPLTARAYGPAGATAVTTVADLLHFAALHLDEPSLAALRVPHADVAIHGWLDAWCLGWARFDWDGGAVWGWDGLVPGERSVLRLLPEQRAAVVLMTNADTGRELYRSLFAELIEATFAINVPPLSLDASPGAAKDLWRFAGTYAWPDDRVEVTPTAAGLLVASEDGVTKALPLDGRAFVLDRTDPDNPAITFGAFDADARPRVLYRMLWGLPRVDK